MHLTLHVSTSRRFAISARNVCLVGENPTCSVPAFVGMRGSTGCTTTGTHDMSTSPPPCALLSHVPFRMSEAVVLFQGICSNPFFERSSIILFLNKKDLFAEKLPVSASSFCPRCWCFGRCCCCCCFCWCPRLCCLLPCMMPTSFSCPRPGPCCFVLVVKDATTWRYGPFNW